MLPIDAYHVINEKPGNILACHWHEEIEIIYLSAGKVTFTIDDATYILNPGDCLFINSSQIHTGYTESDYSDYYSVVFSTELLTNPFDACRVFFERITSNTYVIPPLFRKSTVIHTEIIDELKELINEIEQKEVAYELAVKAKLFAIFHKIFRENLYTVNKESQKKPIRSTKYELLKKILGFVYVNYNKKIKLEEISDHVNLTPQYLCAFFKEMTKTTLTEYINHHRIESALTLIKDSELSMTEIALECGFDTPSYFNRVFKKQVGCSPKNYRTQNN